MPTLPKPRLRDLLEAETLIEDAAAHIERACSALASDDPLKAQLEERLALLRAEGRFALVALAQG